MPSPLKESVSLLPTGLRLSLLLSAVHLFAAGPLSCVPTSAQEFKQPQPLEPAVAPASEEAAQSMAGIRIPEGWKIGLFAAEPDVANVVAFDIDHRGRVFVCESFRQNRGVTDNRGHDDQWRRADLAAETVQDRIDYHKRLLGEAAITYAQHDDRIRRLDDTDNDGVADQSYLLANGFNRLEEGTGAGVLVRGSDIYYTNIPKLWKLIDKDDDGAADERVTLSDGYGVRVAFRGHDMHGLIVGPDGRLYFSIGDRGYHVTTEDGRILANPESGAVFRCELDGSNLEVVATGLRNPQELAFNDWGDLFSVDNNSDSGDKARVVQILEGGDSGWRMHYQYLPDRGPFNRDHLWEPLHAQQPAYIVPPIANYTDGPSGLTCYPGTGFGDALKDTFLICDFRGGPANSGILSFTLQPEGAFYRLDDSGEAIWTVLATDVAFGPDGALYVSDWVDGWEGLGKGRIYRLIDPKHHDTPLVREVQQLLASDWTKRSVAELGRLLGHADRRVRLESHWELARRKDLEALGEFAVTDDAQSMRQLHAIWAIDQIARLDSSLRTEAANTIRPFLEHENPRLRAAAAKSAGQQGDAAATEKLRSLLSDEEPRVKYFAALALGKLKDAAAMNDVVRLLAENDNADPALRHAGVMYLAKLADHQKVGSLAKHESVSVRRAAVVALRRMRSGEIERFLDDGDPMVVAEAARAIHDEPIPVSMNGLAKLIASNTKDPEVVRRVLNANYRLGSEQAAAKIADFSKRLSIDAELRIEALDMLANWANPDSLDRVLGSHRPLEPRNLRTAAEALLPHIDTLMTDNNGARDKAIEVAAVLGIKKIVPQLVARVSDSDQPAETRSASLLALGRLDPKQAISLSQGVKMLPATELSLAALRVLAKLDAQGSLDKFIDATGSRDVRVRQLGWDILSKIDHPRATEAIVAAVKSYLDGSLPADVHLNVLEASGGRISTELSEALAEHTKTLAETDPLAPWLASLEGGNVRAGANIFANKTEVSCQRCHQVDRAGGAVGPNLTLIGKQRDRRYLLESICLPDAQVAKGFETAVILNDSGQLFTGIVKSESDEFIELIQNDGSQQRIDQEEIIDRRKGKSSMPEDLVKQLSPRELRDLVAYLASLKVDPRAENDIE